MNDIDIDNSPIKIKISENISLDNTIDGLNLFLQNFSFNDFYFLKGN